MAKRGRKRRGYFYEREEEAVRQYISATNQEERDRIFNSILRPAFITMVESIIRRYILYLPDEEFQETFDDTFSFLVSKIDNFKPEKGKKAYSYCGTICKNYLIYKHNQFNKKHSRNRSFDLMEGQLSESSEFSTGGDGGVGEEQPFVNELIENTIKKIHNIIACKEEYRLNANEVKLGEALADLLTNWEDIFEKMESNKYNKSTVLLFLKESTHLNTGEIRDGLAKYKTAYFGIKKLMLA